MGNEAGTQITAQSPQIMNSQNYYTDFGLLSKRSGEVGVSIMTNSLLMLDDPELNSGNVSK